MKITDYDISLMEFKKIIQKISYQKLDLFARTIEIEIFKRNKKFIH